MKVSLSALAELHGFDGVQGEWEAGVLAGKA